MTLIKPYFIAINCLFLICVAYLGVRITYDLAESRLKTVNIVATTGKTTGTPSGALRKPLTYYEAVGKRNLFDIKTKTSENIEPVNLESLEQTELKLKLWGTVIGTPENKSYAVIEDTQYKIQTLYHQGDAVQDAVIKMILRGKVVLRVNDRDEILEMEKVQGDGSEAASLFVGPEMMGMPPERAMEGSPLSQKVSLDRAEIAKAMVNLTDLMQQVKITPNFNNGEPEGFRLSGIKTDSLVRKMGLRNGDVIMGVNGNPIQTMEDAMGFYQQLGGADNVSLQIKRRGRERNIEFNIK
jgi:general secretion pathway protein C